MIKTAIVLMLEAFLCLSVTSPFTTDALAQESSTSVAFLDVLDLPARIDEPKLKKTAEGYDLKCAIANRAGEQLLGLRLILLIVEPSGKLRTRITWTEASEVAEYSISTFTLHPRMSQDIQPSDQLFLAVDEVIGHETIWRAMEADRALRAYSRGQHDVIPVVRTVVNKFDPRTDAMRIIWR